MLTKYAPLDEVNQNETKRNKAKTKERKMQTLEQANYLSAHIEEMHYSSTSNLL